MDLHTSDGGLAIEVVAGAARTPCDGQLTVGRRQLGSWVCLRLPVEEAATEEVVGEQLTPATAASRVARRQAGACLPVRVSRRSRTTTVRAMVAAANSQSARPEYLAMIVCRACERARSSSTTLAVPKPITDS